MAQRLAFDLVAGFYDVITNEPPWRRDCQAMGTLVAGPRVLDLGVGPGVSAIEMARAVPGAAFVGLDVSAAMLARARRHAARGGVRLDLVRGDALRLPFPDASFDAAAGHSLLYLLADPEAALGEIRRVVRPGGRVAFLEPRAEAGDLRGAIAEDPRFGVAMALWRLMSRLHRRWSEAGLRALLERAGFSEARAWPALRGFGVMAAARRVDGGREGPYK